MEQSYPDLKYIFMNRYSIGKEHASRRDAEPEPEPTHFGRSRSRSRSRRNGLLGDGAGAVKNSGSGSEKGYNCGKKKTEY